MDKFRLLKALLNKNASMPYQSELSTPEAFQFADWASKNQVPVDLSAKSDYDMPGYFKALLNKKVPEATINPIVGQKHFPDTFKTPRHKAFSNESIYADETAPHWEQGALREQDNKLRALEIPNDLTKQEELLKLFK